MNQNQIRKKFLGENAEILLDEYHGVLKGKAEFSCEEAFYLAKAIDLLTKLIEKADDIVMIEAENAKDVLALLKSGTLTFPEAKELMELFAKAKDIEGGTNVVDEFGFDITVRKKE